MLLEGAKGGGARGAAVNCHPSQCDTGPLLFCCVESKGVPEPLHSGADGEEKFAIGLDYQKTGSTYLVRYLLVHV